MSDLIEARIRAVDSSGMVDDVLAQPHQLSDALWRVESAAIPAHDAAGVCVCGMGSSAIGADLAAGALGESARKPIWVARGYTLPPGLPDDTFVLCASYSGNTEETLACFEAAAGRRRAVLTTGGELARRARDAGVPVIGVPAGMQPRAAAVYMTVSAFECAALAGAAPSLRGEIEAAAALLGRLAREWGPGADDSLAKRLAERLAGTVPVVHGAGPTDAVATRWKAQLNESAKLPAFRASLPEADHNEICAWEDAAALAPLSALFLDDAAVDERVRARMRLTGDAIAAGAAHVEHVEAIGDNAVERLFSLVLLGDLVSVYLAVLAGRDPTPVVPVERFKKALSGA